MDTLTRPTKKNRHNFHKLTFVKVIPYTNNFKSIVSMTKGWQCCKCKEEMYRDENHCNWNRCGHARCSKCRSFQV